MTATTSIHPDNARRPLWAALAFVGAAAFGLAATVVVMDDDGTSGRTESVPQETSAATRSAVPVSADAAEARAFPSHVVVHRSPAETGSADAAERAALAEQARDLRACSYSAAPAEAVERCLNGG